MNPAMLTIVHLTYNPVFGGVISSVFFAVASSIYLLCLRRMRNASLKSLIPNSDSNIAVVCPGGPEHGDTGDEGKMTPEEAMALAEVLQCVGLLNKRPSIYSCAETMRQSGVISLGGIQKNAFTETLISEFCPGLKVGASDSRRSEPCIYYGSEVIGPTRQRSIAFIIYLSSRVTKCENPVLLIFGQYGIDTVAAARYVRTNAKQLHRDFRGRDFAVLLATHPTLGYQGFPKHHKDISKEVFATQFQQTGRWRLARWWHGLMSKRGTLS